MCPAISISSHNNLDFIDASQFLNFENGTIIYKVIAFWSCPHLPLLPPWPTPLWMARKLTLSHNNLDSIDASQFLNFENWTIIKKVIAFWSCPRLPLLPPLPSPSPIARKLTMKFSQNFGVLPPYPSKSFFLPLSPVRLLNFFSVVIKG